MHIPLYRQALSHSWHLMWQHKFLWVFGLFATLLGQMGILDLFTKMTLATSDFGLYPGWLAWPKYLWQVAKDSPSAHLPVDMWSWALWLVVALSGLIAVLIFASVVSQGALVYASAESVKRKILADPGLSWQVGVKHFGRLFFLNACKKIILILLALAVGYGTLNFVLNANGWSFLLFIILFLLVVLVGMTVSFLVLYTAGYIVIEEYNFLEAIEASWKLFLGHWLVSIEVGVIMVILNFALAIVGVLGVMILFFPTIVLWFISTLMANFTLWVMGTIVGVTLAMGFLMFLGTLFTVYNTCAWTYLFMSMHHEGVKSRLLHWLGRVKQK